MRIDIQQRDLSPVNLIQNALHFRIAESGRRHNVDLQKAPVARSLVTDVTASSASCVSFDAHEGKIANKRVRQWMMSKRRHSNLDRYHVYSKWSMTIGRASNDMRRNNNTRLVGCPCRFRPCIFFRNAGHAIRYPATAGFQRIRAKSLLGVEHTSGSLRHQFHAMIVLVLASNLCVTLQRPRWTMNKTTKTSYFLDENDILHIKQVTRSSEVWFIDIVRQRLLTELDTLFATYRVPCLVNCCLVTLE